MTVIFFSTRSLVLFMTLSNCLAQGLFDPGELPNQGQFGDSSNTNSMVGEVDGWDQSDHTQDYANSIFSDQASYSDFLVQSESTDSSYDPTNTGVQIADNHLEDACPPKDSPPKGGSQLKLPNLLDWGFDQDSSPTKLDALCPDAEYKIPLCCSGSFNGRSAGLCVEYDPTHWACQLHSWQFCCKNYWAFLREGEHCQQSWALSTGFDSSHSDSDSLSKRRC